MQEPGDVLRRARRALDGLPGVESIGEWTLDAEKKWRLPITVRRNSFDNPLVPEITDWIVMPDNEFLEGDIELYPAVSASLEATFQHQRYNEIEEGHGRRSGRVCLTRPSHPLGRMGDEEPLESSDRIAWRVSRLISWLNDAAGGTLVLPGDPFEIPDFPKAAEHPFTIVFQEDSSSLQAWHTKPRYGSADILKISDHVSLVADFQDNEDIVCTNDWGSLLKRVKGEAKAIWIRLDDVPVFAPWTPPVNFGDLKKLLADCGLDLCNIISEVADLHPRHLRSGKSMILLLGFPISKKIGESADSLHWQALCIPAISPKNSRGFRSQSLAMRDQMVCLNPSDVLGWLKSENWTEQNLLTRGAFDDNLRKENITVVGAGALGSSVAELLARGGCTDLLIIDGDTFSAGNANRHVLDLADVGRPKADALCDHLKLIRPGIRAKSILSKVGRLTTEQLETVAGSSLIIDTTGSDDVLSWAERQLQESNAVFVSLSFGYAAKRLFCFASPAPIFTQEKFAQLVNPWLAHERATRPADVDLPREGIGCWSAVFPARADDVWLLAATGVKWLESLPEFMEGDAPVFKVFEQKAGTTDGFSGVAIAELPPTN